jgi:hypothetical protein
MIKESVLVPTVKVDWKGTFDYRLLYSKIKDWLVVEGFDKPTETMYVQKNTQKGKNIEVLWKTQTDEQDYFLMKVGIKFYCTDLEDVEVTTPEGKKMKLNKGKISVQINADFVIDAEDRWKDNKGKETVKQKLYEKYFFGDNIEAQKIEFYEKTMDLIDEIKNFFNLYRF